MFKKSFLVFVLVFLVYFTYKSDNSLPTPVHLFLLWTTPPSTFKERNLKVIDSFFYHYPNGNVTVYSNTLNTTFNHFKLHGYTISIEPYSISNMIGCNQSQWIKK